MRKQLDVDLIEVIAQARAEERAAVVAWLRRNPGVSRGPECVTAMTPFESADAIERGAHRREEKP